jgi:hypothetical protein
MATTFGLPAWAINAADIFSQYAPASWVFAGFIVVFIAACTYCILQYGLSLRIKARYDSRYLERGFKINPLDLSFEGQRSS